MEWQGRKFLVKADRAPAHPRSLHCVCMIPSLSLQAGELASQVAASPPGSSEALLALYARMIALYGEARSHVRNALKASSGEGRGEGGTPWGVNGGGARWQRYASAKNRRGGRMGVTCAVPHHGMKGRRGGRRGLTGAPPPAMVLEYNIPCPIFAELFSPAPQPPSSALPRESHPHTSCPHSPHPPPPPCMYCSAAEGDPQYEEMSAVEVAMQGVVLERGIERGQLLVRGGSGAMGPEGASGMHVGGER